MLCGPSSVMLARLWLSGEANRALRDHLMESAHISCLDPKIGIWIKL